jgi:hypothetical protein
MPLNSSDLTQAMQEAFKKEWAAVKKIALPDAGGEDRRLLFAAVARGLLEYVEAHQNEVISAITFEDEGATSITHTVTNTEIGISTE